MAMNEPIRQPPRGRTRDYTIPVRLNQQITTTRTMAAGRGVLQRLVSIISAKQFIAHYLLVLLVIIIVLTKVEQIHCDSQLEDQEIAPPTSDPIRPPKLGATDKQSAAKYSSAISATPTSAATKASGSGRAIESNSSSSSSRKHRERLLAMLSENIERQHLKMAAASLVGHIHRQRPSKFDSGEDVEPAPSLSTTNDRAYTTLSAGEKMPPGETLMRDIMRMHEQPSTRQHTAAGGSLHYTDHHDLASRKKGPTTEMGIDQLDVLQPPFSSNKMVSRLVSYIVTPLVGRMVPKPSDALQILNVSLVRPSRPLFTGRSNPAGATQSPSPLVTPAVSTSRPFLALPNWVKSNRQSAHSTKPSTMFGYGFSPNWIMSSSSADQTKGDLVADSSSEQQQTIAILESTPVGGGKSSSRQNRKVNKEPTVVDKHETEASSKLQASGAHRGASLAEKWLKNRLAQNYLQDSFRGLLTLSQLPILPVGPVSTAPSVLEPRPAAQHQQRRRGSAASSAKPQQTANGDHHQTSVPSSATPNNDERKGYTDRRAKALEDLYRYAYILATSMVGRKRDPLKALSTKTRPRRPPVSFTQRSIGQLAADNRRQISNLIRTLQQALFASSSLASGGGGVGKLQAANPRGVMWDMATDPTLVVTLMHLIERASVALPLGKFYLIDLSEHMMTLAVLRPIY